MNAVGKKKNKKRTYHVTHKHKRSGKGNTGLLLGLAAAAGVYFMLHRSSATVTPVTTDTSGTTPGLSSNPNPVLVDNGSGTGTQVIQPKPITVQPGANLPGQQTTLTVTQQLMVRDAAAYPDIVAVIPRLTATEFYWLKEYFYGYFLPGFTLHRYPDPTDPGHWNTTMYDELQVIFSKYDLPTLENSF